MPSKPLYVGLWFINHEKKIYWQIVPIYFSSFPGYFFDGRLTEKIEHIQIFFSKNQLN